jgi:L-threonylcarbamoyladenylate synthase
MIIEGGKCEGGIESTVCDVTGDVPVILRSGLITREMIKEAVGACDVYSKPVNPNEPVRSPGMKYKHYAPHCETALFNENQLDEVLKKYKSYESAGKKPYILCENSIAQHFEGCNLLLLGENEKQMAANLYSKLHEGEIVADIIIGIEPEKKDGIMTGVINRLTRACR